MSARPLSAAWALIYNIYISGYKWMTSHLSAACPRVRVKKIVCPRATTENPLFQDFWAESAFFSGTQSWRAPASQRARSLIPWARSCFTASALLDLCNTESAPSMIICLGHRVGALLLHNERALQHYTKSASCLYCLNGTDSDISLCNWQLPQFVRETEHAMTSCF